MTFLEAAIEILRNADDAMHFSEVARRAVEENLLSHVGRDPEAAMRSCLNSAVRSGRDGEEPIIVRHKPGYYSIRPGATLPDPPPRPEKPASAPKSKKSKSSDGDGEPAKAKSRSRRRRSNDDDANGGQSETRGRRRRKTRAKGEAPAPASVEVLPVRKAAEKAESKEGGSAAKDAPAAVTPDAAKAASVKNVEFEAPTGSGLEGVTDVALVMANAMSRLVEERPELKDELEALQQKEQRAEVETPVVPARTVAPSPSRGASRAAASAASNASEERGGRRRRRRRRRGKRVDWSAGSERPGEATVNDKLLDGVATVLGEAGSRSLHVRQVAETLAGRGLLGGEISEIERAVTAAVMVDIHRRGRASRFVARGEARYQLQGSRLPDPAAKAEQALRGAALELDNQTGAQLFAWLQSLGARALESLVRIYLTREGYQLVVALPPSRGVGKLVVEDPSSEDDEGRQLVLVVPKRTAIDPKLWEGELERNNCAGLTLFAMGEVPDDLSLDDARVISVDELSRWMRDNRVGVQPLSVEALALDATFIESIAGLDT